MTDLVLRQLLCALGQRAWSRGFCNGNEGNFSARLPDNNLLITPTGVSKGFMAPEQLCTVDLAGRQLDPAGYAYRPTSELGLHLAIYRRRPDVGAIMHLHTPYATAFACSAVPLPERLHPEAQAILGKVVKTPYTQPGDTRVGQVVADAMDDQTTSVLLANHGVVCFHKDATATYYLLEMLEGYCRLAHLLAQLGPAQELTPAQLAAIPRYNFE